MSCAGRNHMAKGSQASRDFTDTNWDGRVNAGEALAVLDSDCGNGLLRVFDVVPEMDGNNGLSAEPVTVALPGKFHKLIWFLRGDIIVHDGATVMRKVSDEQLKRLAREAADDAAAAARREATSSCSAGEGGDGGGGSGGSGVSALFTIAYAHHSSRRGESSLVSTRTDAQSAEQVSRLDGRNPNRKTSRVSTGFTSSDDDDGDGDAEEGEEEADERDE